MISKRQLLTVGAGAVAASTGVWFAQQQEPQPLAQPNHLDALWQLNLPTPSGKTLSLASFKGKPLLINFWATWCPPCVQEMPLLEQFHQQNSRNGIQLLGIAVDKQASVDIFLAKHRLSFPIVLAGFEGMSISKALGNETGGLPHTVLIDAKGAILFDKKGQLATNDLRNIPSLIL